MYRPGKILKSGTWSDPEFPGRAVTNRAAAIDMTAASPAWREVAPMNYRRSYHTLTVLPDGKVLATGGQTTTDGVDETTGILGTEIWDPDTDAWTPTAAHRRPRLYHSSALLLPDARVLLAGGGAFGNAKNEKSAEIYSPPYLFKGPRPTVTGAPDHRQLRPAVRREHARRGADPVGVARPHGLGHAQPRHGPALHPARRAGPVGRREGRRTVERQRGAARLVHGLPGGRPTACRRSARS